MWVGNVCKVTLLVQTNPPLVSLKTICYAVLYFGTMSDYIERISTFLL